jgi:hypothetical protein
MSDAFFPSGVSKFGFVPVGYRPRHRAIHILPGNRCELLEPNPWCGGEPIWKNVSSRVQCTAMTWRWLFANQDNADTNFQREYWDLIIVNGIVPQ